MTILAIVKYRVGKGDNARVYTLSRHESFDAAERAAADAKLHGYLNAFVVIPDKSE